MAVGENSKLVAVYGYLRLGIVLSALLLFGVGGWAVTTEIAGAVIASGQIVAESNPKKIQHVTGGTIAEIHVKEGMLVREGDLLIKLDEQLARSNLSIVTSSLRETLVTYARLLAERDELPAIVYPETLLALKKDPEVSRLMETENKLFTLRAQSRAGQKAQFAERLAQTGEEIAGLNRQLEARNREIEVMAKELKSTRTLWEKNLIPISRVTSIERDAIRTSGEVGRLNAAIAQARGRISETELQILQVDQQARSDVAKELRDTQAKIVELSEKRASAEEQLARIEIRAPQDGYVLQLQVFNRGAVIVAGTPFMTIVPSEDKLAVEVKVPSTSIDQVKIDSRARIRFTSLNQRTTPELDSKVYRVSADAETDQRTNAAFYTVRVTLENDQLRRLDNATRIMPGMPVEVYITTEDRTVMSYLVKPMSDQVMRAFRER